MVGLLTFGKKFESVDDVMRKRISPLHDNLQAMLDKDSDAFTEYLVREGGREGGRERERGGDGIEGERFTRTKRNQSLTRTHSLPSLPPSPSHTRSLSCPVQVALKLPQTTEVEKVK